jgi:uncharacterized protein YndB with AHSA1/START domain
MKKIIEKITISASKEAIWSTITDRNKYQLWTEAFTKGSYFEGGWNKGDSIRFLAANKDGGLDGMISEIAENELYKFISIRHLGYIYNGVEDTTSDEIKSWAPSYENYSIREIDGKTCEFTLEMDATDDFYEMFLKLWPKALIKIKEISEEFGLNPAMLTCENLVDASLNHVWECWTDPKHIIHWNAASPDWHCPKATNNLEENGQFTYTMASRDGEMSFDFKGIFTKIIPLKQIEYALEDARKVIINFEAEGNKIKVCEKFEGETENLMHLQQMGWQAILDNFKTYTEKTDQK